MIPKTFAVVLSIALSGCLPTETSPQGAASSGTAAPESVVNNSFYRPNKCMKIFGRSSSADGALLIAQAVQNKVRWYDDVVGVYRLYDGSYGAVADYRGSDTIKSTQEGERSIALSIKRGDYPAGTRCTDGSIFTEYTGKRSSGLDKTNTNKGPSLAEYGAGVLLGAIERAQSPSTNQSSSATGSTSTSTLSCKILCTGQFNAVRGELMINTPYSDNLAAENYAREQAYDYCHALPFFSGGGGSAAPESPTCR